ncbi:MAG: molybdenum cofactor biosynthesis protein B [Planctomycetota bacterium]|nr:MAG: molybdenum cofactor biosynthesis protein B [Planctomycetota bacterium]
MAPASAGGRTAASGSGEHPVPAQHRAAAAGRAVRCCVITVSDSRTAASDVSGQEAVRALAAHGHQVVRRALVPDDPVRIAAELGAALAAPEVEAVVLTGGTGVGPRDRTPEAVAPLLERELPGFGELFRMLSHAEIGAAAMLSRALGGLGAGGRPIFCLPGSPRAVALAIERLIGPELAHLVVLARGG